MTMPPVNLIVIPLAATLIFLFIAAFLYDLIIFRRRRKQKSKIIYQCSNCGRLYTAVHRIPLARCPECGTQNAPART